MFYSYNKDLDFDNLLDRILNTTTLTENISFVDRGDSYVLTRPLVAAKREDVNVLIKGDTLEVSYSPKEKNVYAASFVRNWKLTGVDAENVSADLKDGLLTVTVPKIKPAQPKVRTVAVN